MITPCLPMLATAAQPFDSDEHVFEVETLVRHAVVTLVRINNEVTTPGLLELGTLFEHLLRSGCCFSQQSLRRVGSGLARSFSNSLYTG
jgi:hypothetical protein